MSSQRLESSLDAGHHQQKRKTSVASRKLSARMDSEISDAFRLFDRVSNCLSHCSKSSFFVQKFIFDFPRKLSIFFLVEKLVKMLWFWTF